MATYCYTFTYYGCAFKIWTMQIIKIKVKRMQIDVHCEHDSCTEKKETDKNKISILIHKHKTERLKNWQS